MINRSNPPISTRKRPQQTRSQQLVADILAAAVRVLARDGAQRFTSARVAEEAGISVGSLYQYFPNKAAILFQLQTNEWRQTSEMLQAILTDAQRAPHERLRALVHAFINSECEEAQTRVALNDAAPLYRDSPEAQEARASGDKIFQVFLQEILPESTEVTRALAEELITTTLTAAGKQFSETPRTAREIEAYSDAMADMFCAYLTNLENGRNGR